MINLKRTYSEENASMIDLMRKLNATRRTFKSICDQMQKYEKFIDPKILNSFEENVISVSYTHLRTGYGHTRSYAFGPG